MTMAVRNGRNWRLWRDFRRVEKKEEGIGTKLRERTGMGLIFGPNRLDGARQVVQGCLDDQFFKKPNKRIEILD